MGILDNLSIMLGNSVASSVFNWIRAASAEVDGVSPNLSQAAWFINPVGGNDNNSGLTTTTALQTFAEYRRRVRTGPLLVSQTVTIMASLLTTDVLDLELLDTGRFTLTVTGQTTVVAGSANTITTYTPRVAATNAPNQLLPTVPVVWTPFVGNGFFVSPTSGPGVGKRMSVLLDVAGTARMGTNIGLESAETQPANGNTFEILSIPTVTNTKFGSWSTGISIQNLNFITNQVFINGGPNTSLATQPSNNWQFQYCCFTEPPVLRGDPSFIGCQMMKSLSAGRFAIIGSGRTRFNGCVFFDPVGTAWTIDEASIVTFSNGTTFQGCPVTVLGSFPTFNNAAFFDTVATAILARRGSVVVANTLYGTIGASFACTLQRADHVILTGAGQTLTGGGNEIAMVLTANTTWAAARAAGGVKDGATSDASAMVET